MLSFIFSINQKLRVTLSLIYLGIVIILSLMPSKDIPDISPFNGFDKVVHLCLYLGFSWLLCWALHSEKRTYLYSLILLICVIWGIIMETFQLYMHFGRSFEWFDVISNTSGALTGILLYHLMTRKKLIAKY